VVNTEPCSRSAEAGAANAMSHERRPTALYSQKMRDERKNTLLIWEEAINHLFFINNIDAEVVATRLIAATNVGRGGVCE
jgi:hypothetical protein